jgi:flagellar hook-basal body complex protein FliE
MDDLQVKGVSSLPLEKAGSEKKVAHDPVSDFKKILSQSVEEVNGLLNNADQSAQEMVAGRMDIHQAMVAIEQAQISFSLLLQVRNKMIDAYQQIMQMQI